LILDDDKYRYLVLETRDCEAVLGQPFDPNGDSYTHSDTSTKTWVRILTTDVPNYITQPVTIYTYDEFMAEKVQALFQIDADYYLDRGLPIPGEPLI
jgi:hypothetical protein